MRIATDKFAVRARHLGRPRARPQASESAARADGARRRENREGPSGRPDARRCGVSTVMYLGEVYTYTAYTAIYSTDSCYVL